MRRRVGGEVEERWEGVVAVDKYIYIYICIYIYVYVVPFMMAIAPAIAASSKSVTTYAHANTHRGGTRSGGKGGRKLIDLEPSRPRICVTVCDSYVMYVCIYIYVYIIYIYTFITHT
jgi:hypothetical protein